MDDALLDLPLLPIAEEEEDEEEGGATVEEVVTRFEGDVAREGLKGIAPFSLGSCLKPGLKGSGEPGLMP